VAKKKKKIKKEKSPYKDLGWYHPKHQKWGGFGTHELLDRAHILMSNWDELVAQHGATRINPQLNKLAQQIGGLMYDFYNNAGLVQTTAECEKVEAHGLEWLEKVDPRVKKQVEEYDAEKALREKWNEGWIEKPMPTDLPDSCE
jgi:hypothetical protein